MSVVSRFGRCLLVAGVVLIGARTASANLLWTWQFGSEAGTFVTNGTLDDTNGPFDFTFLSFSVTSSVDPEDVGTNYAGNDLPQGFLWNGLQPTEFYRGGGTFTNGSNFFNASDGHMVGLNTPNSVLKTFGDGEILDSGPIGIVPQQTINAQVPTLSPAVLGLLGLLVAGAALRILRATS